MDLKEILDFIDITLKKTYTSAKDFSNRERCFSQTMKISEELGELTEQVLGKFGGQRAKKSSKISDSQLEEELADVILSTVRLARMMNMDIEKILKNRMKSLRKRFDE